MHKFGKVVLSRKGFDSSAGGGYSPFDPKTGEYIVLPIPDGKIGAYIGNGTRYEQIKIKPNYLDRINASTLEELVNSDALRFVNTKAKVKEAITNNYAHFDPWLGDCPWLEDKSNHQIGAFGQVDRPQAQLHTQGVGEGSLFLFFSRFEPIKTTSQDSEKIVVPDNISREHLGGGLYFIYGWLKVKEVIQQYKPIKDDYPELLSRHPHATKEYFDYYANKENGKNTIYIADEFLFNDGSNIRGCGYFPTLNEDLLLTAPAQESEKSWIPSRWSLKGFFKENCSSVLKCKGQIRDGSWLVETGWQWQEAVFDFDESEEFCQWFCQLLKTSC